MVKSAFIETKNGKFYALKDGKLAKNMKVTKYFSEYAFMSLYSETALSSSIPSFAGS